MMVIMDLHCWSLAAATWWPLWLKLFSCGRRMVLGSATAFALRGAQALRSLGPLLGTAALTTGGA